jgi:glutamate-1-semialdehyde 2,1-aminomutase
MVNMTIEQAEAIFRAGSPRSQEEFERGRAVMPGVAKGAYFYGPYPLAMERGEGCYLFDLDERRFVDFAGHHTAQILGHGNPAVLKAVTAQLQRGIAMGAPVGIERELAAEICARVASVERVRFCNSGTEATLHAIRLARGFARKPKVAKFEGAYHGSHDAVEISVAPPLDLAGPSDAPNSVPGAGGMYPGAADDCIVLPYNDEAAVERLIAAHAHELACVIFEPKAGIFTQRPEFVRFLREVTERYGVLLIMDEIVAFRLGYGGAQELYGIQPDLTTFGKIIGGGFPVGAFGGRADLMDLLDNTRGSTGFYQSGTFSAHPVTMAAGLAMLRQLTPEAFAYLNLLGDRLRAGLTALFARKNIPAQIVGIGSLFSIHFTREPVVDYRSAARADKAMARRLFLALMDKGYYMSQGVSMCAISLPMQNDHIDGLVEAVDQLM